MAFTLPMFNLSLNIWEPGHTPLADPPDRAGIMGQIYVLSRPSLEVTPGDKKFWVHPINLRIAKEEVACLEGTIVEDPASPFGGYYKIRWGCRCHAGFDNEYQMYLMELCNSDGSVRYDIS